MNRIYFPIVMAVLLAIFSSCSADNSAQVVIKTGLNSQLRSLRMSIPDRILSIFSNRLYAAEPPSNISVMNLRITGSDMKEITMTTTPVAEIRVTVPAGSDRTFTLTASTPSATLQGKATTDLAAGESKTISINMLIHDSKIIIPDRYRSRIIQINDISGSGWTELDYSVFSPLGLSTFSPYDVDMDNRGRIYIANYGFSTGDDIIIRMNDFNSPQPEVFASGSGNAFVAVAFDRNTDYMYFATGSALYKKHVNSTEAAIVVNYGGVEPDIRGLSVDDEGYLYIALNDNAEEQILRINPLLSYPSNRTLIINSGISYGWDVMYKDGYLYVANVSTLTATENKILRYTLSGVYSGYLHESPDSSDSFVGPKRFLPIFNRRFCVIDCANMDLKRLIWFEEFSGAGWQSYYGDSAFLFYHAC